MNLNGKHSFLQEKQNQILDLIENVRKHKDPGIIKTMHNYIFSAVKSALKSLFFLQKTTVCIVIWSALCMD